MKRILIIMCLLMISFTVSATIKVVVCQGSDVESRYMKEVSLFKVSDSIAIGHPRAPYNGREIVALDSFSMSLTLNNATFATNGLTLGRDCKYNTFDLISESYPLQAGYFKIRGGEKDIVVIVGTSTAGEIDKAHSILKEIRKCFLGFKYGIHQYVKLQGVIRPESGFAGSSPDTYRLTCDGMSGQ